MATSALLLSCYAGQALADAAPPAAMVIDGIPPMPDSIVAATAPYLQSRSAIFLGWDDKTHAALVKTRFGNVDEVHRVTSPMGMRTQMTFDSEPVFSASMAPGTADVMLVMKDVGGGEFYQLFAAQDGRMTLLTDGKSRNWFDCWSRDGKLIAYTSTRRDGSDSDIYVMDPRNAASARMVLQVAGGGWSVTDFSPDGHHALVLNRLQITHGALFELDLGTGHLTTLVSPDRSLAVELARYTPDGSIWAISDRGENFKQLVQLDRKTGALTTRSTTPHWNVDDYAIAPTGHSIAYTSNEDGITRLHVLDYQTGKTRDVTTFPVGANWTWPTGLSIAPWGAIGLTLSSAKAPNDMYAVDAKALKVTRWTVSETGGLDSSQNVEPELVSVQSFDGVRVSGFLYLPDSRKFAGRRPLIIDIHGGPEGQSRPEFLGKANYYLNELGVALFYPNVRGSDGYGRAFLSLDNGAFKREDSVKDIGRFLHELARNPDVDSARIGIAGASYGGYMCYASATHFSSLIKGGSCGVAISNFVTFLEHTQSYRRDLRRVEYGDERDPKQRAKLEDISPLNHVGDIKVPLMVTTGGNDPRVPASEAHQIVAALRAKGEPVWHMVAKDEGHGYHKKANVDYDFWVNVMFWKKYLLAGETQK